MFSFDQIPLQDIPYFREVIVMASSCDTCGYRNSELKPGGSIPEKGKKITLHVTKVEDLNRDVIKVCLFDVIKM
jgi:zinc finger protein